MSSQESPATWSHPEGVDYEVAMDILTRLVALAGQRITTLQQNPGADQLLLNLWQARRQAWGQRRLDLTPTDTEAVQLVLDKDGPTLQALLQLDPHTPLEALP